jgi:hypothetical protein
MLSAISELLVILGVVLALYVVALVIFRLGATLIRRGRAPGPGDGCGR